MKPFANTCYSLLVFYSQAMPSRTEFQQLALSRLEEAKLLHANHFHDGAIYLAGYSLELALKARICYLLDSDYPTGGDFKQAFFSHRFETLIFLAGLKNKLSAKKATDTAFGVNWSLVADPTNGWNETFRYKSIGSSSISKTAEVLDALENSTHGILPWIKTLW